MRGVASSDQNQGADPHISGTQRIGHNDRLEVLFSLIVMPFHVQH